MAHKDLAMQQILRRNFNYSKIPDAWMWTMMDNNNLMYVMVLNSFLVPALPDAQGIVLLKL